MSISSSSPLSTLDSKPLILLSNDDGIHADGLRALIARMRTLGDVWVVAPDRERSATSHALSLHKPLRLRQLAEQEFCVDGTPTDCVYLGVHHLLPRMPDLVISGINHGLNLGSDVLYSGTISAAMEGAMLGCRAMAISLCLADHHGERDQDAMHFDTAAHVAERVLQQVGPNNVPAGVLLNVNVPNVAFDAIHGMRVTRLGYSDWAHKVIRREDPRGRAYYWIGGERRTSVVHASGSDFEAIEAGYVSVTPVHFDLTDTRSLDLLRNVSF